MAWFAILGVVAGVGLAGGAGVLFLWAQRKAIAKGVAKRLFGIDVDINTLNFQLQRRPLRLLVTADEVIVYTPPGVANKDIAIKVPRIIATVKKLDKETRKATGHIWAMEATLVDMKVYYVFVELGETNFDRLVKQVLKVQGDKVPKDQRTKQLEAVAKEQGVELPEEPKIDPFVVSNVYLEGITQVLVRANTIPLLPPISVSEVQIDPEIMKNPVGLFLWINALVLKTLERSGFHLVNAVASSAIVAGLAAKGTSQAAIKGMVTGGGMAWDCTYRGISSAAGDTIAAGRVVVSSTWTGAAEMYKYVGMGVDGASHGIGNFGMSTGDAGHKVFADTGHFLDGATQTTIGVGGKVVAGTSRVVGDAGKSTWTAGSHAVSGAGAAVEDAGKATWEATTGTLKQAGKGSWGVTTTTAAGVASGLSSVGRGITSLFGSNSKGRKPQT